MAWNQDLSDQAASPVRAHPPVTAGEWGARIAVSAFFLFLASFSINQIAALHILELDLLGWARLMSSASVVGFLLMIAWLTIVRSAPVARASGAMPRIAAILGTWLFLLGSPFLTRRTEAFVGRVFTLEKPIANGVGHVRIDDTIWRVSGPDMPAGSRVRIVRTEGANLFVEPVEA